MSRRLITTLFVLATAVGLIGFLWKAPEDSTPAQPSGEGEGQGAAEVSDLGPDDGRTTDEPGHTTANSNPAESDATDPSGTGHRTPVVAPNPSGIVLDARGEPAVGAVVTWTPKDAADEYTPGNRWEAVRAASLEVVTDSQGRFEFDRAKMPDEELVAAIWVTHVGSTIEGREVNWRSGGPYTPLRFNLSEGEVSDAGARLEGNAARIPFASVRLLGELGVANDPDMQSLQSSSFLRWATPLLAREFVANAAGDAEVPIPPHPCVFTAVHGELQAESKLAYLPTLHDFILLETYTLRLRLTGDELLGEDESELNLVVMSYSPDTSEIQEINKTRIPPSGGPHEFRLPRSDKSSHTVRVWSAMTIPVYENLGSPPAGSVQEVTVALRQTEGFAVRVVDPTGVPIQGAFLQGVFYEEDGTTGQTSEFYTDENGRALLVGFPEVQAWIHVSAENFASTLFGPQPAYPLDRAVDHEYEITVEPSATLKGVVHHEGKPVDTFQVTLWRGSENAIVETFHGAEDGQFELLNIPVGTLSVRVSSATHGLGPSSILEMSVAPGEVEEVSIELDASLEGFGRVIDGDTLEPIEGALVAVNVSAGWRSLSAFAAELGEQGALTDAEGRWNALGFTQGRCNIQVSAEGYPYFITMAYGEGQERLDFGTIPLYRGRDLHVILEGAEGEDLSGCTVSCSGSIAGGPVVTGPDGHAVLANLPTGLFDVRVDMPDGSIRQESRFLYPSGDATLRFKLDSDAGFDLSFVDESGTPIEWEGSIACFEKTNRPQGQGAAWYFERALTHSIRGLSPGEYLVRAWDSNGVCQGVRPIHAQSGNFRSESFVLDSRKATLRVVDIHGQPISDVDVRLVVNGTGSSLAESARTDGDGECTFDINPELPAQAWLRHPIHGDHPAVDVHFSADGSPSIIIMDPRGFVRAALRSEGRPLTGVVVIASRANTESALAMASTDGDGRVEFRDIGPGPHVLKVRAPGYWPTDVTVDSHPHPGSWDVVNVPRTVDLRIELEGQGLESLVRIDLQHSKSGVWVSSWIADGLVAGTLIPSNIGTITLSGLPVAEYRWAAVLDGGDVVDGEFTLESTTAPNQLSIRL